MDIRIGVPVLAQDAEIGRVDRIILHPATLEVDGIVVLQSRLLPSDVVIPVDRVEAAGADGVQVRGTVEEIGTLEPFSSGQYSDPPQEWIPPTDGAESFYLFPASTLAVGAFVAPNALPTDEEEEFQEGDDLEVSGTTTVFCTDGVGGTVESVVTEGSTDHVTHLVVQRGALNVRDVSVSVDHVVRMDAEGVFLDLSEQEVDALPALQE